MSSTPVFRAYQDVRTPFGTGTSIGSSLDRRTVLYVGFGPELGTGQRFHAVRFPAGTRWIDDRILEQWN